ncbi:MAG TPA: AMP-binding protein, partial [Kineosporiaceae bacterium]|nr:AMP-binding protein [Kineosporiaceae bacterium]
MSLDQIDASRSGSIQRNVAADLADRAERQGWSAAPAYIVNDRVWTHGEVHDLAAGATSVLIDSGVRPGNRVVIALPDGIGWVISFLAVARLGAVAVLINPELTAEDHAFMIGDCRPTLCLSESILEDRFDSGSWLDVDDLLVRSITAARARPQRVGSRTALYIQYTSGTTGEPKGVVHDHGHLPVYFEAVGRSVLGLGQQDISLSISKLFFAYGFGNALVFPLYSGSSAV